MPHIAYSRSTQIQEAIWTSTPGSPYAIYHQKIASTQLHKLCKPTAPHVTVYLLHGLTGRTRSNQKQSYIF